ncbi:MAG: transporter substrate-binding domain-containing protein [Eubacteriales bacterium]|nr:transporter substrate-binding domain-containing protein [Eubacteriales bacterium]
MKYGRRLTMLVMLCIILLMGSGCGKKDVYTVAFIHENPPYIYKDGEQWRGLTVDLLDAMAAAEHWQYELVLLEEDKLDARVAKGTVDGVLSPGEKRLKDYEPTDSYADTRVCIAAREGIQAPDALADVANKRIGVYKYSDVLDVPLAHRDKYGYFLKTYETMSDLKRGLVDGEVDYVFDDQLRVNALERDGLTLREGYTKTLDTGVVISVPKVNDRFISLFNKGLISLVNDGTYEKIMNQYRD